VQLGGLRARPNEIKAWSSRPSWNHYDCAMLIAEMLHNTRLSTETETVLLIFPSSRPTSLFRWGQVEDSLHSCSSLECLLWQKITVPDDCSVYLDQIQDGIMASCLSRGQKYDMITRRIRYVVVSMTCLWYRLSSLEGRVTSVHGKIAVNL